MDRKAKVSLLLLLLSGLCKAHAGDDHDGDNDNSAVESNRKEDISTTILRMNNGSLDTLLQGDVLIPKTRNAMKCLSQQYSCFWQKSPNGLVEVPYEINAMYDETEKNTILTAMKSFESKTCIRFVEHGNERAYLSIEPRFGCASEVGRTGEMQLVSLQRFGCVENGIVQHEMLHALGFYHEHTRSDRDDYVQVNWKNIEDGYADNFDKMDTDNLNTHYDYSSVMHYGKTAFGIKGAETLTPIPNPNVDVGQRVGMSDIDILRVNILYKCTNYLG